MAFYVFGAFDDIVAEGWRSDQFRFNGVFESFQDDPNALQTAEGEAAKREPETPSQGHQAELEIQVPKGPWPHP